MVYAVYEFPLYNMLARTLLLIYKRDWEAKAERWLASSHHGNLDWPPAAPVQWLLISHLQIAWKKERCSFGSDAAAGAPQRQRRAGGPQQWDALALDLISLILTAACFLNQSRLYYRPRTNEAMCQCSALLYAGLSLEWVQWVHRTHKFFENGYQIYTFSWQFNKHSLNAKFM